jgi:hypothetical protein
MSIQPTGIQAKKVMIDYVTIQCPDPIISQYEASLLQGKKPVLHRIILNISCIGDENRV